MHFCRFLERLEQIRPPSVIVIFGPGRSRQRRHCPIVAATARMRLPLEVPFKRRDLSGVNTLQRACASGNDLCLNVQTHFQRLLIGLLFDFELALLLAVLREFSRVLALVYFFLQKD